MGTPGEEDKPVHNPEEPKFSGARRFLLLEKEGSCSGSQKVPVPGSRLQLGGTLDPQRGNRRSR